MARDNAKSLLGLGRHRLTRTRLTILVVAVVAVIGSSLQAPALASPRHLIQVWDVNIHRFKDSNWRSVFDPMDADNYRPDIVLVQDIANIDWEDANSTRDSEEFRDALSSRMGTFYRYVHADDAHEGPNAGNVMVLYRNDRFDFEETVVERWSAVNDENQNGVCGDVKEEFPRKHVALRLWDMDQTRSVAVTSVHYPPGVPPGPDNQVCTYKNVNRTNNALENVAPVRRMTIMGGDMNMRPDDGEDASEEGDPGHGEEPNPDCWYRWTSPLHDNEVVRPINLHFCDIPRQPETDTYFDSIWVDRAGANPSEALCSLWTSRIGPPGGTACTDLDGSDPPRLDRARIDYIWARWEDPNGDPRPLTQADAEAIVQRADVDRLDIRNGSTRYSDHRAVQALLRWCLPTETC